MAFKKITRNETDFSEIFHHAAKEPWNISWNPANDVFFNTILEYKSHNDFYLSDLEHDIEYQIKRLKEGEDKTDTIIAQEVVASYMKENNIQELRVYND